MAKYTKTLEEFMNGGGSLPSLFDQIEGFRQLFLMRFLDYEIGFNDDLAFSRKLTEKAMLYIPEFKKKIALIATYYTKAENPTRTHYDTVNTVLVVGDQSTSIKELPIDPATAQPSSITESDEYTNHDTRSATATDEGETTAEVIAMLDALNKEIAPLVEKLLNKFECCFMGVY